MLPLVVPLTVRELETIDVAMMPAIPVAEGEALANEPVIAARELRRQISVDACVIALPFVRLGLRWKAGRKEATYW